MATDSFTLPAFQSVVTVETGPARRPTLSVEYEGSEPPLELFSCLTLLGFDGLVPQPPPSSAIQWGTSGSTASTMPTILPYRATAAATLSARPSEVDRALDATRFVLGRLSPAAPDAAAVRAERADDARSSPTRSGSLLAGTMERLAGLTERSPGAATEPPRPEVAQLEVEVVADLSVAEDIRAVLEQHGVVLESSPTTFTAEVTYRGQRTESHHRAVRLRASVESAGRQDLVAALSRYPLRSVELSR